MTTSTERLLEMAEAGESLSTEDRRRALGYLSDVRPDMKQVDLAEIFKVSPSQIRKDLRVVREASAEDLKTDDVYLVVADTMAVFKRQVRDLEASKAKAKLGTKEYVQHCSAIMKFELDKVKTLQELGYLPKDMSKASEESFEYEAIVTKGDNVETRSLNQFDADTQKKLIARRQKSLPPTQPIVDITPDEPAPRDIEYVKAD